MIKLKHFPTMPETMLRQISEPVKDAKEAEEIKQKLIEMFPDKGAFAVAAVQIGIPKRATLIRFPSNNKKPDEPPVYTFVCNPVVAEKDELTTYNRIAKHPLAKEGCLSFPKKYRNTYRYNKIKVNYKDVLGGELDDRAFIADGIEAVILQHEIDHMDGHVFFDGAVKQEPVRSLKIGRNEPCLCGSGKKYKKCCIEDGE